MKNCINDIISKTFTLRKKHTNTGKKIGQLRNDLILSGLNPEMADDLIELCINFLNEDNLRGILIAQDFLKTIMLQIPNSYTSELLGRVDQIKEKFSELLPPQLQKKPKKTENALLYFHLRASKFSAYPFIALQCHRALRHVEAVLLNEVLAENITPAMAKRRLEHIVIPFLHIVRFYGADPAEKFMLRLSPKKIYEALLAGKDSNTVRYSTDEVFESYERDVNAANSGYFMYRGRSQKRTCDWGRQSIFGRKLIIETVEEDEVGSPIQFSTHICVEAHASIEASEGSYALEDSIIENVTQFSNDDIVQKIIAEQIRPAQYPSFYQHGVRLNALNLLLSELIFRHDKIEMMTDIQISTAAYFLIFLFYGFSPKRALNLKINPLSLSTSHASSRGDLYIDFALSKFHYKCDSDLIVDTFSPAPITDPHENVYLKTSDHISIPINSIEYVLREVYKRKKNRNPYLFDLNGSATRGQLLEVFKAIIRKALQGTPFTSITANSISRTFSCYGANKYKIDPLVLELISGRATREFRAPRFYTAVSLKRIHKDHRAYCTLLLADLIKNSQEIGLSFKKDLFNQEEAPDEDGTTGSSYVPSLTLLKETLFKIKLLLHEKNLTRVEYHNLYTFYNVLIVMLTTAMRPVEIERLYSTDFNRSNLSISINGKRNRLFNESRIIPVPEITIDALREIIKENTSFADWVLASGRLTSEKISLQSERNKAFFLASESGVLKPASSSNIRSFIEKTQGLEFPFKLNSPRHLLRTFLFESKMHYSTLNAFCGHQTAGKEFFSYFSLDRFANLRHLTKKIEKLANELCLTALISR